jgi:nucleoside-diphosphate-sugar epimerase
MKIFITGATGYIGSILAMRLADEGHQIVALCRDVSKGGILNNPNISLVKGDITDVDSMILGMKGCEQVYHLAGFARVWVKDKATYYRLNVEGTKNVIEAAIQNGIKRMVNTSTCGVFGPAYNDVPVVEDDARDVPWFYEYEETKQQAEDLCKSYSLAKKIDIITVNPPRVYGPGVDTESNAVTKLVERYLRNQFVAIPGNANHKGCYAHVQDIVTGHILAMQRGRAGERYILGGENIAYHKLYAMMGELSNEKRKISKMPVWFMRWFSYVQMLKTTITGKPPLFTPRWTKKLNYSWALSSNKAVQELGYSIIPFRQGLLETIDWVKKNRL